MNIQQSDIGLIGLAVMGQNLALNIADHNFNISVYNRTYSKTREFLENNTNTPGHLNGFEELSEFVNSIKKPRKIVLLVQAGNATDSIINSLTPLLDKKDIIIDGGNAKWEDTIRREKDLNEKNIRFIGSGVSGGEEGARFGPSLMPGGSLDAWQELEPIWTAIAAKVDPNTGKPILGATPGNPVKSGISCTQYIGPNGSGHYVKMVHNGIEYGDMQMICEAYHLLRSLLNLSPKEIGNIFKSWNEGLLDSFLIEITADILKQDDPKTNKPFIDSVLDTAGQKGTGKWTSFNALEMGIPAPTIAEAVFARCLSAIKEERVYASHILKNEKNLNHKNFENQDKLIEAIHDALYCSKICSYAQGFQLMQEANKINNWNLNFAGIAEIFRGGCIIRAAFLQKISDAFNNDNNLKNLLLDSYFKNTILGAEKNWRKVISLAVEHGIPVPTFSSSIAYFDSYRAATLPQNLLQAQRDYFGAHTYERIDSKRGEFFHFDWSAKNNRKELKS